MTETFSATIILLDAVLALAASFVVLYLLLLVLAGLLFRSRLNPSRTFRRFAVVIPAHDEANGIARTVQSCFSCAYPRDAFDVIVVADNCTDRTADLARGAGAKVLERTDDVDRGKGHALRWAFARLIPSGFDAVVVVDADSKLSTNFLSVMNDYLATGVRVLQATDVVEPARGSWSVEMTRIGFLLYNVARPLGRRVLGGSMGLRGNGMCFAVGVLKEHPWSAFSLTEDVEYSLNLTLAGERIVFAPEASVYAVMPQQSENALTQRARWEGGRIPLLRKYHASLLRAAVRTRSFRLFDAWMDLVIPAVVNFTALLGLVFLAHLAAWTAGLAVPSGLLIGWFAIFAGMVLQVLVGLASARAPAASYVSLLKVPLFVAWKIRVYVEHILRRRKKDWVRTTREDPPAD